MMDITENDAPGGYKAKGFPAIHFFPAGKDQKVIDFKDERTTKSIIECLKEKTIKEFEFTVSTVGKGPFLEEDEE